MPTAKFKSFEEAADALLLQPRSKSAAARMRALFAMSARISSVRTTPGVRKFRSLEAAAEDRAARRK